MKKLIFLFVLILVSCKDSRPVNTPKNLIDKDKMAALIADFAISDQMGMMNPSGNLDTSSRFILNKHGVTAKQFTESYEYYLSSPATVRDILDEAQDIIKSQDPEAEKFIDKKLKEIANTAQPSAR